MKRVVHGSALKIEACERSCDVLRRLLFPPLLIPPRLSSFAGYLYQLFFRELFGAGLPPFNPPRRPSFLASSRSSSSALSFIPNPRYSLIDTRVTGKGKTMKRQIVLLLVVAVAMLAMAGGVAVALSKGCSGGDCVGSREADTITGSTGTDVVALLEGNDTYTDAENGNSDEIYGDEGNDTITDNASSGENGGDRDIIYGDEGNDTINVREDEDGDFQDPISGRMLGDTVDCGQGKKDKVFFDEGVDTVTRCEIKNPGL